MGVLELLEAEEAQQLPAPAAAGAPAPPVDARPAAERFASQLVTMQSMGFGDDALSLRALEAVHGNVQMAIERILDGRA